MNRKQRRKSAKRKDVSKPRKLSETHPVLAGACVFVLVLILGFVFGVPLLCAF